MFRRIKNALVQPLKRTSPAPAESQPSPRPNPATSHWHRQMEERKVICNAFLKAGYDIDVHDFAFVRKYDQIRMLSKFVETPFKPGTRFTIWWSQGKILDILDQAGNSIGFNEDANMASLVHMYSNQLAKEVEQMMVIERDLVESGEATIYGQMFNDNQSLTRRQMNALSKAFEEDSFDVVKCDYEKGTLTLRLQDRVGGG